jgi:hypothetical protein
MSLGNLPGLFLSPTADFSRTNHLYLEWYPQ